MVTTRFNAPSNWARNAISSDICDVVRPLLTRILDGASENGTGLQIVGLTSAVPGEGVSTLAAHLAVVLASSSLQPVLLVDGNLEEPSVHERFGLKYGPGLAEVLLNPEGHLLIQPSGLPNLDILVGGNAGGQSALAQDSVNLPAVLQGIRADYGHVVVDLPATTTGPFTNRVARLLDGIVLVVQSERVSWEAIQQEKDQLTQVGAPLLGAVLNQHRTHLPRWLQNIL